ncbi:MAG: penicillin-binding protein [Salinivirgaceae bacterium]
MSIRGQIIGRIGLVYAFVVVFALAILGAILNIQYGQASRWLQHEKNNFRERTITPTRGDVRARDGRLLASSVPEYEIRMDLVSEALDPKVFNAKVDSLAQGLSSIFGDKSAKVYKDDLLAARYRKERYYLVQRDVTHMQLKKLEQLPIFRLGQYKGGFIVISKSDRKKPFNQLASRTIGYSFPDDEAVGVGLEAAYDSILSGVSGKRMEQRIVGNYWKPISDEATRDPVNGMDLISTIDINIQDVAHSALYRTLSSHDARHGTAILMEVKTGEILAISNLQRAENGHYYETFNFAVGENTEPGSTFKLPILMAAMEDGYIDINDSIDTDNGTIKFYDHTIRDSRRGGYGKITVQQVLEYSSNVGMAKIATKYYRGKEKDFVEKLYSMHLNEKSGICIPGEPAPYIKYPGDKYWSGLSLPQMAYGYEVQMTPLQILMFYNAVANGGTMVAPRLVKGIQNHGKYIKRFEPVVVDKQIASPSTIKKAHLMLQGVVENGSARNLANLNFRIAGKTGTAQIANKKYGYKYQSVVSYQASFVGYFPADNPRYSCIVVVNEPSNSQYYGNAVAGPVFREIADKVYATRHEMHTPLDQVRADISDLVPYSFSGNRGDLNYLLNEFNIPIDDKSIGTPWVVTTRANSDIIFENRILRRKIVPNVAGMGLRDALSILENAGLKVTFSGYGIVSNQSLSANQVYQKGQLIHLTLSNNF